MYWHCTAWRNQRVVHPIATVAFRSDWPACFRTCGILTESTIIDSGSVGCLSDLGSCDQAAPADFTQSNSSGHCAPGRFCDDTLLDGRILIYIDGACVNNQHKRLRKAGVGVWCGPDHPRNFSAPLQGCQQTNQRAEIAAVIEALRLENRKVHIKTDSEHVLQGCNKPTTNNITTTTSTATANSNIYSNITIIPLLTTTLSSQTHNT